jgi:hypothetical protein
MRVKPDVERRDQQHADDGAQAWAHISGPSTSKLSLNWMSVPSMIFLRRVLRSIKGSRRRS